MLLTLSRKFELSLSRRLYRRELSPDENYRLYGIREESPHGHGLNPVLHVVMAGPVDGQTGMLANLSDVKQIVNGLLISRFDHKNLNRDTPPFDSLPPTAENIAKVLLHNLSELFASSAAKPAAVHIQESPDSSATAYRNGRIERTISFHFCAGRRTYSPHLTDSENETLFGAASRRSGHGHTYRLTITLAGECNESSGLVVEQAKVDSAIRDVLELVDHRNLNVDVPQLKEKPVTTENLARTLMQFLSSRLPVSRIRLHELPYFAIECSSDLRMKLILKDHFLASHRLNQASLSPERNRELYGKCNHVSGHGHRYEVEIALRGHYDERTGVIGHLAFGNSILQEGLAAYHMKHLDEEVADFSGVPSTGENIVQRLWHRLDPLFDYHLERLRLWETPNNRFTLRRERIDV